MGEGVAWCLLAAVAAPELNVCPPSPGPELVHGINHVLGMAILHARGTCGRTRSQAPRGLVLWRDVCSLRGGHVAFPVFLYSLTKPLPRPASARPQARHRGTDDSCGAMWPSARPPGCTEPDSS